MERLLSVIYQYIVLIAIISLAIMSFIETGQFNEMLLGALLGVMIPVPQGEELVKKTVKKKATKNTDIES